MKATGTILALMSDSFDMEEGFQMKLDETMESADDIPLVEVKA